MNWSIRLLIWVSFIPALLILLYTLGPRVETYELSPTVSWYRKPPVPLCAMDSLVAATEPANIKANNQARIVWGTDSIQTTPYAMVYLHGFTSSYGEGLPIHEKIAHEFGINTYIARLQAHGLVTDSPLVDFRPVPYLQSVKEALRIGSLLGDTLLVMGTSTGAMMAMYLAAHNPEINRLILLSPNIELHDPAAFLLDEPWGYQIAKLVFGGELSVEEPESEQHAQYWYKAFAVKSLTYLKSLMDYTMTDETLQAIQQPTYIGYYYRNEEEQDQTVSVDAMLVFKGILEENRVPHVFQAFPNAQHHVIGSRITNPHWENVYHSIKTYLIQEAYLPVKSVTTEPK